MGEKTEFYAQLEMYYQCGIYLLFCFQNKFEKYYCKDLFASLTIYTALQCPGSVWILMKTTGLHCTGGGVVCGSSTDDPTSPFCPPSNSSPTLSGGRVFQILLSSSQKQSKNGRGMREFGENIGGPFASR